MEDLNANKTNNEKQKPFSFFLRIVWNFETPIVLDYCNLTKIAFSGQTFANVYTNRNYGLGLWDPIKHTPTYTQIVHFNMEGPERQPKQQTDTGNSY